MKLDVIYATTTQNCVVFDYLGYAIVMSTPKSSFFSGVNVRRFRELPSPTHKLVTHVKIDVKNDEQN